MAEGQITFSAQHAPSYDTFEKVILTALTQQVGGDGHVRVEKRVSVADARAYAAEIEQACRIVEADQRG